ncbi:hypothetical protein PINS_up015174 [Pythium insidiosum]|nr:hypothetical protein PINS_up015174 [Pythium insidiosum]
METKKRRLEDSEMSALLDHGDFARINDEMKQYDETREQIIKRSREILKSSKQAIFSLHRGDTNTAANLLLKAEQVTSELVPLTKENPSLRHGALSSALEEYAEAKCFAHYLETHTLLSQRAMANVEREEYLGGVTDFTGELVRYAIVKATARDEAAVRRCHAMVEAISGELIQFDFRNGPLRKKYDSVKYNLRKLENTLYELSLIQANGLKLQADPVVEEQAQHDTAAE